jgi:glycosyltransferase involved in cell wall biosynthesis
MMPKEQPGDPAASAQVSVVVPTRNRSKLAAARARWALAQPDVRETIFVVDAAADDTAIVLGDIADHDARLQVIDLQRNVGPPAARNIGIQAATSEWVLVIDDDDIASDGFIATLLAVARESGADVVGAPWFNVGPDTTIDAVLAAAPRAPGGPALDRPGILPDTEWVECLWMPANSLFRRSIFDTIAYDERFTGSFYREETDVFVAAARTGSRVVVTSRAYTYIRSRAAGGINRASRVRYEYSVLKNNWYFLRKHGRWLRDAGLIRSALREQAALVARRARPLARAAGRRATRWAGRAGWART